MTVLKAEWTKLRTVRGWMIALALGAAFMVALGLLSGAQGSCGKQGNVCVLPVGPEGQEVSDAFYFVHQPLTGDGGITVRVTSLTSQFEPDEAAIVVPWAKAGLIIKDGTRQGSAYAAIMLTGGNGTRMQHNFVHDKAGQPGSSPRWLRLTRAGDTITGEESVDGTNWTVVGTVRLPGLPATAQIGMFVTSPQHAEASGVAGTSGGPTQTTAAFENISPSGGWTGVNIGGPSNLPPSGGHQQDGMRFTVTGSGDIAPAVAGAAGIGTTVTQALIGTFAGLVLFVVIGAMFATSEYRRGLIHTTLAATPARARVLVAKAIVIGTAAFLLGASMAAVLLAFGPDIMRANGAYVHPVPVETLVRMVLGTGALLAFAAILALALGVLLRRSATAVTAAIVTIVLPYLLALSVLPAGAAQWVLRVAPAAAFALQQSSPQYHQVANLYTPVNGYFPLAPWAGFGVLAAWTVLALALATYRLTRRDA